WVGDDSGLSEFRPDRNQTDRRFESYTTANGLSFTRITALGEDRDHNLWIGTSVGGAMRRAANGFTTYKQSDGLGGVGIGSIFEDRAGHLWVVSGAGNISRFD